ALAATGGDDAFDAFAGERLDVPGDLLQRALATERARYGRDAVGAEALDEPRALAPVPTPRRQQRDALRVHDREISTDVAEHARALHVTQRGDEDARTRTIAAIRWSEDRVGQVTGGDVHRVSSSAREPSLGAEPCDERCVVGGLLLGAQPAVGQHDPRLLAA